MNRFENITKPLMWFMALMLTTFMAGCGDGASSPILGGGGAGNVPHVAGDTTKPRVTVTVPANLAPSVPTNSKITATFSEAMDSATITAAGTFTLAQSGVPGTVAVGPVTYTVGSRTADIKPSADLNPGSVYTATITTAAKDLAGNALAGISANPLVANNHVWTFTAASGVDNTPPTIISTTPASGVISVPTNATVNATFSEAMDPSTISSSTFTVAASGIPSVAGTYAYDVPSRVATFTPSSLLQTFTLYTATIIGATDLAGNALVVPAVGPPNNPWTFTTGNGLAPGAVALGSASTFGIMATAAVTAASASTINGDVSLEPGTSITGFPPAVINGAVHVNDTVSHQARNDLLAAYNNAKGLACTTSVGTADLGTLYVSPAGIPPGVYCSGSTMLVGVGHPIVLDGGGDANAVWVFQIGSSLTVNADVTLIGGAQAKNVFWVPTQDATIAISTGTKTFNGTLVTGRDATSSGGATIDGRILAGAITAGTIALNGTPSTINVPAP
jgi:Ice-binding-like/Bacterial Ig-like domain